MLTQLESLYCRFGNPEHYIDFFVYELDQTNMSQVFKKFHANRGKSDNYEASRQSFLRLLSQDKMFWSRTNEEIDLNVDICRIYRRDETEYIAYMRIKPGGFRAERVVSEGTEMVFHLLIGSVVFTQRGKVRNMTRGNSVTVQPKTTYSLRCMIQCDQPAILLFRIQKKPKST